VGVFVGKYGKQPVDPRYLHHLPISEVGMRFNWSLVLCFVPQLFYLHNQCHHSLIISYTITDNAISVFVGESCYVPWFPWCSMTYIMFH